MWWKQIPQEVRNRRNQWRSFWGQSKSWARLWRASEREPNCELCLTSHWTTTINTQKAGATPVLLTTNVRIVLGMYEKWTISGQWMRLELESSSVYKKWLESTCLKQISERVMRNGGGYIKSDPYSKTRRQCNVILEPFNHQGNAQGSSESITPRNTQAEVGLPVSDTLADKDSCRQPLQCILILQYMW